MTRCPAPTRTADGVLRCVQTLDGCSTPSHRRWDAYAPLLERVWAIKPWWPNLYGWAQDHGRAHVENIDPCRHCTDPKRIQVFRAGWPDRHNPRHPVRTIGRSAWWARVGPYVIGDIEAWDRSGAA